MGTLCSKEEKAPRDALTVSNRRDIVVSWIKRLGLNIEYFPLDIINIIITYSNRIFKFEYQDSKFGYFTTAMDGLTTKKSKASNWYGKDKHGFEPQHAGICFGGILRDDMKYYCVIKCYGSCNIGVAVQDMSFWSWKKLNTGPLWYKLIDCYVRIDDSVKLDHLLKVTVDMKSKVLTLFNQTMQRTMDRTSIDKDWCQICFIAVNKWTTIQVVDQGWL